MTPDKINKIEVDYTDKAMNKNERCALCKYFYNPPFCRIVSGLISEEGWCDRFTKDKTK